MVKVLRNQGMPSYRHHDYGNLYIKFDVKFPERLGGPEGEALSDQAKAALESVLPPRITGPTPPPEAMVEDFTLEDLDPTREHAQSRGVNMDEDDDDVPPGAERVQCASQ
jgi:DnaJ homolog subfamily A member 2